MRISMRFLLGFAFSIGFVSTAFSGEPMATITSCDQIEIGGHTYPRFHFQVHNTSLGGICQMTFGLDGPEGGEADTCVAITATGPSGWGVHTFPGRVDWGGCFAGGIDPGETMSGFEVVVTRGCCGRLVLFNVIENVQVEEFCLQCPTPAERATWGVLKSRYR